MKIKNICRIFLAALLCIALCSCQQLLPLRLYEVYVCERNKGLTDTAIPVEYNISDNTYSMPKTVGYRKLTTSQKSLSLGDDTIPLEYERTYNYDGCEYFVDSYSNMTYSMTVNYHAKHGTPVYINLGSYEYRIADSAISDNDTLMAVSASFLKNYVGDLSVYTASTTTRIQRIDENGVDNDIINGFETTESEADKITYTVDFIYCIDGIKTSEAISISLTSEGYLKSVSLNMIGEFAEYSDVDVDIQRCDELISKEVDSLCDIDGVEYHGYTDSKILVILDNRLCLLTYVTPELSNKDGDMHAGTVELLIPVSR